MQLALWPLCLSPAVWRLHAVNNVVKRGVQIMIVLDSSPWILTKDPHLQFVAICNLWVCSYSASEMYVSLYSKYQPVL